MHTKVTAYRNSNSFFGFIILIWLTGLMIGLAVAFHYEAVTVPLLQGTYLEQVSLWGIFLSGVLPLFITYFFIRLQWMFALYVNIFTKALLYGYSFFSILFSYQQGAWLTIGISFLGQTCCCMLMLFLCLYVYCDRFTLRKIFLYAFSTYVSVCLIECFVISLTKKGFL